MPKDMDNHYVSNFTAVHVFRIPLNVENVKNYEHCSTHIIIH